MSIEEAGMAKTVLCREETRYLSDESRLGTYKVYAGLLPDWLDGTSGVVVTIP